MLSDCITWIEYNKVATRHGVSLETMIRRQVSGHCSMLSSLAGALLGITVDILFIWSLRVGA